MRKQLKSKVTLQVRFVFAQQNIHLQEFLDTKKFCGSETTRNLKRLVLQSKHAVSAQEIFLERRKNILHISLAKSTVTEAISHFACELFPLNCLTVCQGSTHITQIRLLLKRFNLLI